MAFNYLLNVPKYYKILIKGKYFNHLHLRHLCVDNVHNSRLLDTSEEILRDTINLKDANTNHSIIDQKINTLCTHYENLKEADRYNFLVDLAKNYTTNYIAVQKTATTLSNEKTDNIPRVVELTEQLQYELSPSYQWLFTHIGRQEGGVKFLVDLRADLLKLLTIRKSNQQQSTHLQRLNRELKSLLLLWFSVGFLRLQRVTWYSPCDMLQKVSEYEAVHPVRSWTDLKQRVAEDRRCFVYTHGSMPREPLVVLHTALRNDIISSVQGLMGPAWGSAAALPSHGPPNPKAAIFYSISATQPGLQGIELGNYIIKRVAGELLTEFPELKRLSTLSPVPGFRNWLFQNLEKILWRDEKDLLSKILDIANESEMFHELKRLLSSNAWLQQPDLPHVLQPIFTRLCIRYIYFEKKGLYARCSVANFHLRNGAELWRVNWLADSGARGLASSCGIMVNYRYRIADGDPPDTADSNSLSYIQRGHITISDKHITPIVELLQTRDD